MKLTTVKRIIGNLDGAALRVSTIDETLRELVEVQRLQIGLMANLLANPASSGSAAAVGSSPAKSAAWDPIAVTPIVDIPFPVADLAAVANPLPAIVDSAELATASGFFAQSATATRSLVSAASQALLYSLIRNLKPERVIEIGTYRAGSSEAICRALERNGKGLLHTIDPFGAERVPILLSQWPLELRRHIRFHAIDSMEFFAKFGTSGDGRVDLVFVDGNHDYPFAAFDIASAARVLSPGGFIVIDNVSQAGPFFAARDFLAINPHWIECAVTDVPSNPGAAFDTARSAIPGTDFLVMRAPSTCLVTSRPATSGEFALGGSRLDAVLVSLGTPINPGVLSVQVVLRGFGQHIDPVERASFVQRAVAATDAGADLRIDLPLDLGPGYDSVRIEIWLAWNGAGALPLRRPPSVAP